MSHKGELFIFVAVITLKVNFIITNKAIIMKKNTSLLLLFLSALATFAQQAKQVYVTLDVSGSMYGNKYVLANYTTQMIVTLCDDDDDVHMILYGQEKVLSDEKNPLDAIQKPVNKLVFGNPKSRDSQFDDIIGFNQVYRPSKDKQNWLFIIGDGQWGTMNPGYAEDVKKFQDCVKGGSLNVCYLQTGESLNEQFDFTDFAEDLGVIDIKKSSIKPKTIQDGCDHFARKILGFSNTSLNIKKSDAKTLKVECELPVKEFLLVYQDEVTPEKLPTIQDAQFSGKKLEVRHKGTPTTKPVKQNSKEKNLSGNVWRMKTKGSIPANTPIEIAFDKNINVNCINIYPIVEEIEFGSFGLAPYGTPLKQIGDNTFTICRDEKTARVRIELNEGQKENLPESLLKKTKVVVKANNREYPASYKDGGFECTIDLKDEQTQYYAECDCPGYFSRITPIMTIVKGECEPVEPPVKELPGVDFGTMTFSQLKGEPIRGIIQDSETLEQLNPENFDITVEIEDDYMYQEPSLSIEGNMLLIDVKPQSDLCECLFPTDLKMKVVSSPKSGAFSDKNYQKTVTPIHLRIEKDRPWLSRCLWVLITLAALLLFMLYLRLLLKKNRFKKNAIITPRYNNYFGDLIDDQGGRKLRADGFGAWFARWFLPGDERSTHYIDKPTIGSITFIASESKEVVRIPKSCCDWDKMYISGYDPDTDMSKSKTVSLGDNGTIEVTKPNGSRDGEIVFTSGSENDGGGYRMFLCLLMIAALIAFVVLLTLMLKSL